MTHRIPVAGIAVYAPDGRYLRNLPNAPRNLHTIVIRTEPEGEVLLSISASAIPGTFKDTQLNKGEYGALMSGLAMAPNGDPYVSDGDASDNVHLTHHLANGAPGDSYDAARRCGQRTWGRVRLQVEFLRPEFSDSIGSRVERVTKLVRGFNGNIDRYKSGASIAIN